MTRLRLVLALTTIAVLIAACGGNGPAASGDTGCPAVQVSDPATGQPLDLSGAWSGNDGGLYYVKQIGTCVWWSGLSNFDGQYPGQEWIMTFKGTMNSDGQIDGDFVDVKSTNPGSGTMTIEARPDQVNGAAVVQLYRTAATGHAIGVTFWQRSTEPNPTEVPVVTTIPSPAPS